MASVRVAAAFGVTAIALGAFGAHGLENILAEHGRKDVWTTAAHYHLVHAVVLLVLALTDHAFPTWVWRVFLIGICIFSGSLYALALTNIGMLGAVTPIGGLALIGGWLGLVFSKIKG